jgi:hypothetical protein
MKHVHVGDPQGCMTCMVRYLKTQKLFAKLEKYFITEYPICIQNDFRRISDYVTVYPANQGHYDGDDIIMSRAVWWRKHYKSATKIVANFVVHNKIKPIAMNYDLGDVKQVMEQNQGVNFCMVVIDPVRHGQQIAQRIRSAWNSLPDLYDVTDQNELNRVINKVRHFAPEEHNAFISLQWQRACEMKTSALGGRVHISSSFENLPRLPHCMLYAASASGKSYYAVNDEWYKVKVPTAPVYPSHMRNWMPYQMMKYTFKFRFKTVRDAHAYKLKYPKVYNKVIASCYPDFVDNAKRTKTK